MVALAAAVECGRRLIGRTGLPDVVVCLGVSALGTVDLRLGELDRVIADHSDLVGSGSANLDVALHPGDLSLIAAFLAYVLSVLREDH